MASPPPAHQSACSGSGERNPHRRRPSPKLVELSRKHHCHGGTAPAGPSRVWRGVRSKETAGRLQLDGRLQTGTPLTGQPVRSCAAHVEPLHLSQICVTYLLDLCSTPLHLSSIGAGPATPPGEQGRRQKIVTWLILPVVIRSSQRLSHACLSINNHTVKLRMAHYISYSLFDSTYYLDNRSNSRANTCVNSQLLLRAGCIY